MMGLNEVDIDTTVIYVVQVFSIVQTFINFAFYYKIKFFVEGKFGKSWYKSKRNSVIFGMIGWLISGYEALARAIFISNNWLGISITFLYTNECTNGICASCTAYRIWLEWGFCWAIAANYMVMISILDETLGASKLKFSLGFLRGLKICLFGPLATVYLSWVVGVQSKVYQLRSDANNLVCFNDNESTTSLNTLLLQVMAFWLILMALFILVLFILKLRQLYTQTKQQMESSRPSSASPSISSTTKHNRSLIAITNVMAKQTNVVALHMISTFFLFIVSSAIATHQLSVMTAPLLSLMHSFITYLMYPPGNKMYHCLCFLPHLCCMACYGERIVPDDGLSTEHDRLDDSEIDDEMRSKLTSKSNSISGSESFDETTHGVTGEDTVGTLTRLEYDPETVGTIDFRPPERLTSGDSILPVSAL